MFLDNNSGLGKFQTVMPIRRKSNLNCFNFVAIGYPIGLIIDGEKGNCVETADASKIKLENIFFTGMEVLDTEVNKKNEEILGIYVNGTASYDETQESLSSTFLKSQKGNQVLTEEGGCLQI